MTLETWLILGVLVIFIVLLGIMLYVCLMDVLNTVAYKNKRKNLDIALENVLCTYYRTREYENCVYEIQILYKDIVLSDSMLANKFSNMVLLLENHILRINTENVTIKNENIEIDAYKKCVQELIKEFNRRNPLEQIKGTHHVVFKNLITHLEKGEIEEGKSLINALAVEMKTTEDNLLEKEKNSRKQDLMTKIGIALSVIFGIMTFVQFFV